MAAALQTFAPLRNPNPRLHGARTPGALCRLDSPPFLQLQSARGHRDLARSPLSKSGPVVSACRRRTLQLVPFAASHEDSRHPDIDLEREKGEGGINASESQEAWKQSLEHFKAEALRVKAMSIEAYEIYSKKAMEVLLETSEKLKIQADEARKDLTEVTKEVSVEGQHYLAMAAEKSPDSIKEIVETFKSVGELKSISEAQDYHVGVPYGSFLAVGGFLNFMLTGSIPAIRFGIILGSAILALSISSLRSWKNGHASPLLLKAQAAIAAIIFLRELAVFFEVGTFLTLLTFLISGAVAGFYIYRIQTGGQKGPGTEQKPENN